MHDHDAERARLSRSHDGYLRSGRTARWEGDAPGNREAAAERSAVVLEMIDRSGAWDGGTVLDVGCGPGGALAALAEHLAPTRAVGVDLLAPSLHLATARLGPRVALADGRRLPFPDSTASLVVAFTLFATVSPEHRPALAAEVARVLRPGGAVVLYDLRAPSPGNRWVRPLRRRELGALFPGFSGEIRSLTVLPPLARRLGRRAPSAYPALARLPFLRTHLAAVLVRGEGPDGGER